MEVLCMYSKLVEPVPLSVLTFQTSFLSCFVTTFTFRKPRTKPMMMSWWKPAVTELNKMVLKINELTGQQIKMFLLKLERNGKLEVSLETANV